MGNHSPLNKQQQSIDDSITTQFLSEFQAFRNQGEFGAKSLTHGGKLAIFQRKQKDSHSQDQNRKELIALNFQSICKQKTINELQNLKNHINYYKKRIQISSDSDSDTVSSIVRLLHFSIKNQMTNELIYPQNDSYKNCKKQTDNPRRLPSCGFDNIFTNRYNKQPSISAGKKQIYTFSFLHQFNMDSLQKEIQFRYENNEYFKEKEIWSILYCCCKAANKMVMSQLKEPVLSPGSIFINQKCEIKVSEWQLVNYFCATHSFLEQISEEQGQTLMTNDLQMTISQSRSGQNMDILTKYYWPPEGLVEMQNVLRLGQAQRQGDQKLSEAKNSQVFCLGMTMLQMLTLKPYYQKATYSEKQLSKIIEEAIQIREDMNQPMSQEIADLLLQMLQWDPLQRFRYSDIIEYVHQVFETNEMIFSETIRGSIQVISARSYNDDDEQPTNQATGRIGIVPVAQMSVKSNKIFSEFGPNSNKQNQIQSLSKSLYKDESNRLILINEEIEVKIDRLEDSGVMGPGKGDDYNPHCSDQECEQVLPYKSLPKHHFQKQCLSYNFIHLTKPDSQDSQQHSLQPFVSQEQQAPDEDVDYEGESICSNYKSNILSQQKRQVECFKNPFQSIQAQNSPRQFSVYQYVPQNWPISNATYESKSNSFQKQIKSELKKQFNQSKDSMASFNLKFLNKSNQEISMRKNFSFEPLFPESNNKFSSPADLYTNNLSSIVKQTTSPQFQKSQNKQNAFSFQAGTEDAGIFTSPNILEMIKEFTKKQNQQTPDFNAIQMTNDKFKTKNQIIVNNQASKKLSFDEQHSLIQKQFDHCYGSSLFESTQNNIFPSKQIKQIKFNNASFNQTIVKVEFTKGIYQGALKNGARNGYGTFYYKQGGKYSGYWYNNKMDGHGTLHYPDGRIAYEGQWQNDSLHGKGVLYNQKPIKIEGRYDYTSFNECENQECWISYDGWFQNDQKSGYGQLLLSNHQKYVGEFRNDMVHGKGKFYKVDGSIFEGQWIDNCLIREDQ